MGLGTWLTTPRIYILLLALILTLRSPTLLDSMYLVDEGYSGAIASEMLYGGAIYETAVDMRAPFIYYSYYGVFLLAGQNNLFAIHLVAILIVFVVAALTRTIGSWLAGTQAGGWASLGFVLFSHSYLPRDTLAANIEIFTLLPLTFGLFLFLSGNRNRRRVTLALSGVMISVAMFYRQPSVLYMAVFGAYFLYVWLIAKVIDGRIALSHALSTLFGFVACTAALIAWHQSQGNWDSLVFWVWTTSKRYIAVDTTLGFVLRRFLLFHITFILAGALLWFFGVGELIRRIRAAVTRHNEEDAAWVVIIGWFAVSYATVYLGWRFTGHYHLLIIPPLALFAGKALTAFVNRRCTATEKHPRRIVAGIAAAALVPAAGFLIMAFVIREQTVAFKPITQYVTAHTNQTDRIFVWGSAPQVYSFSNRRMASRMTTCAYLVGMFASRPRNGDIDESKWIVPGSWDMLARDFKAHPPELIVDMSPVSNDWARHPMSKYPFMAAYLTGYQKETSVIGADIYRRILPDS